MHAAFASFIALADPASPAGGPLWMVAPFGAMLLAVALMPLIFKHHWERFFHLWSAVLGGIGIGCYLTMTGGARVCSAAHDYVSFMALIGSLFVVAGGIHLRVKENAGPWTNLIFLAIGSVLANAIGTTGASMLLIRPWLRMNRSRIAGFHVVFFIFLVSNVAGCLTPIGDPPLFLGYLSGVPFWWVLSRCWEPWLLTVGLLLGVFLVFDLLHFRKTPPSVKEPETASGTWRVYGAHNLAFLAIIVGSVFIRRPLFLREGAMLAAAAASWFTTPRRLHQSNEFSFGPLKEVAWLFAGIFATMIPALDYLHANAGSLGLTSPWRFYWVTGSLSGFLDNAPTYMALLTSAAGIAGTEIPAQMREFILHHDRTLMAISVSSVCFGAATYIGNGPNFMVKAIAEQAGVKMPDFFRYIFLFSIPILLPLLFLVGLLFFRG